MTVMCVHTHVNTFIGFRPLPVVFGQDANDNKPKEHNEDAEEVCKDCFHRQWAVSLSADSIATEEREMKITSEISCMLIYRETTPALCFSLCV